MVKWRYFEEETVVNEQGENCDYITACFNFDNVDEAVECLNYEAKRHGARFLGALIASSEEPDGSLTRCWYGSVRMIEI